jgi:hypothetical protein
MKPFALDDAGFVQFDDFDGLAASDDVFNGRHHDGGLWTGDEIKSIDCGALKHVIAARGWWTAKTTIMRCKACLSKL